VALTIVPKREGRVLSMRPSPRDGLYALASAWASSERSVSTFQAKPAAASGENPDNEAPAGPDYWPDGPSAA
jgi:hypothetical protein